MITVGVDPGLVATGLAVFQDGILVKAFIARGNRTSETSDRIVDIADQLRDNCPLADVLYVERMAYRRDQKASPEIMMNISVLSGTCLRLAKPSADVRFILPQSWKGRADKDVFISRIRLILNPDERKLLDSVKPASLAHNAADAVGLGLFALGRLTPATRSIKK